MTSDTLDLFDEIYEEFFSYYPELFVPQRQVYAYRNKFPDHALYLLFTDSAKVIYLLAKQSKQSEKDFQLSHQVCSKIYEKYKIAVTPQITYQLFLCLFQSKFCLVD